jgi:hypothetical protein
VGLESFSITLSPNYSGKTISDTTYRSTAIIVTNWATDSFLRNPDLTGFNTFNNMRENSSRITLSNVAIHRDGVTGNGSGCPLHISLSGSQILVANCSTLGDKNSRLYSMATTSLTPGPNVVLNYLYQQPVESIELHMRWAHGFLVENQEGGALSLKNRKTGGSGHGWAVNNGMSVVYTLSSFS